MEFPSIKRLPDNARVWLFGFDRKMDTETRNAVAADLKEFIDNWTSHDERVHGAFDVAEDQFVLLAGWCEDDLGGCSIDSSFALIRSFRDRYGLDGLNRNIVFFRSKKGEIEVLTRDEFGKEVADGRLDGETVVFDLTITRVGDIRAGRFETTFDRCWHARVFAA